MIKRTITPEPGIYHGVPEAEYFSWDCFSKSMIPATMKSAKHLRQYLESEKRSDAMALGSLVDAMLLEPVALDKYGVLPDTYISDKGDEKPWNANAKVCKKELAAIRSVGLIPIKRKYIDEAEKIKAAVLQNETASNIISESKKQVAMVWVDEDTGILCKGRLDCLLPTRMGDLKTTKDASKGSFSKDMYNFGYHQQAAMYQDGYKRLNQDSELPFYLIAAENVEPNCVAVYTVGEASIDLGREEYKKALNVYSGYLKDDPELIQGYPDKSRWIEVPGWALKKFDEDVLEDTE